MLFWLITHTQLLFSFTLVLFSSYICRLKSKRCITFGFWDYAVEFKGPDPTMATTAYMSQNNRFGADWAFSMTSGALSDTVLNI